MKEFTSLTEIGQVRRLSRLAVRALESYDLDVIDMRLIAQSFNTVYRIRCRGVRALLLRVGSSFRLHSADSDTMAAAWQRDLLRDLGLKVPQYVSARDGSIVQPVSLDGVPGSRDCAVLTWVPGRTVGPRVTLEQAAQSGRLSARLHEHAASWDLPDGLVVPIADRVSYLDNEPVFDTLTRHRSIFLEAEERAQQYIDAIWSEEPGPPHLLHGDLTVHNTIVNRAALFPIDFQDLAIGHEVQDISISLLPLRRLDTSGSLSRAFRSGYEELRLWPRYGPDIFEALFAARRVLMANLSIHLRRPDMEAYLDRAADFLALWMRS
jgi:Ser/Thr protein kinase RdoA (MazF antagonist)